MGGPVWIRWLLTALLLVVAGYHVHRLVAAGREPVPGRDRAVDMAHLAMSVGMAVMSSPVGGPLSPASWLTLFCLVTAWAVTGCRHGGEAPHLALAGAAMVYMLAAGSHDAGHMSGPWAVHTHPAGGGLALPGLAWAFATYFVIYAACTAAKPSRTPRLVMALGMSYMLLMTV